MDSWGLRVLTSRPDARTVATHFMYAGITLARDVILVRERNILGGYVSSLRDQTLESSPHVLFCTWEAARTTGRPTGPKGLTAQAHKGRSSGFRQSEQAWPTPSPTTPTFKRMASLSSSTARPPGAFPSSRQILHLKKLRPKSVLNVVASNSSR